MGDKVKPPSPPSGTPVWVKIVLGVSLALNLLIAGIVAGALMRFGGGDHPRSRVNYALPYVQALPASDRRAVMRAIRREGREGGQSGHEARKSLYEDMLAALRADPFDPETAEQLLERQARASARIQSLARTVWLERVAMMSAEERQAYADRIEATLRRGPRHGRL